MLSECPFCRRQLNLPDNAAGKQVRCPAQDCQKTFTLPAGMKPAPPRPVLVAPAAPKHAAPPPPGQGSSFDLGGGAVGPQVDFGFEPEPVVSRPEPWYYGFLDRYALVWKWIAFLVFGLMVLVVTATAGFWCFTTLAATRGGGNAGNTAAVVSCLAAAAFWLLAILHLVLGLVGTLVGVAYLHLVVDAARNIRALNLKHR